MPISEQHIRALEALGMSDNEARLYLAISESSTTRLSKIVKKSGIKRSSSYAIAKSLEEKGFVSRIEMRGIRRYVAVPMRALLRKARGMMEKLEKATPEIEAFEKKEDKQTVVKFF